MDAKVIKKTQDTLGKIVKKPPLSDKLLNKPPFRFLHDVISSVIKTSGFGKGLYTDSEMHSDNVKDKDAKVAYLQKMIDLVVAISGSKLSVRPSKIVAGHEPEKTNEFLQAMASAVSKKIDTKPFVEKIKSGVDPGSAKPPKDREPSADRRKKKEEDKGKGDTNDDDRKKKRDEEKGKDREKSRDRRDKDRSKDKEKDKDRDKDKDRSKDRDRDKSKDRRERHKEKSGRERESSADKDKERRRRKEKEEDKENDESQPMVNGEGATEDAEKPPKASRKHRGKEEQEHRRHREREERKGREKKEPEVNGSVGEGDIPPQVAANRRLARPSSARPAPPRVKKNEQEPEPPMVVGSGSVPNVIVDNKDSDSDDDADAFITKEESISTEQSQETINDDDEDDAEHGGLVKKILDSKKELEGGSQQAGRGQRKTEIERSGVPDATRRKERQMVQKDIDRIRASIQTLTRSANPLGKIMDYIQEDLDQMQKENEMWKKENRENSNLLLQEQSATDKSIEPLKSALTELDQAIADQVDLIAAVKSNIIRNNDKIEKMLSTVTKS